MSRCGCRACVEASAQLRAPTASNAPTLQVQLLPATAPCVALRFGSHTFLGSDARRIRSSVFTPHHTHTLHTQYDSTPHAALQMLAFYSNETPCLDLVTQARCVLQRVTRI